MGEEIHQIMSSDSDKEIGAKPIEQEKQERPFSKLTRTLSESELKSVGVQKILLSQMDEFEKCKGELETFRTKYYVADKKCAEYAVKVSANNKSEALYSILLAMGSALLGLYSSISDSTARKVVLICGIVSFFASIVIKLWVGNVKIEKL